MDDGKDEINDQKLFSNQIDDFGGEGDCENETS